MDSDYFASDDYLKSLTSNWIKNEILYQQAEKYHFDKEESIQYKMGNFKKQLIIDSYVHYLLQTNINVSENEIRNFYFQNRSSFLRDVDEAKVSHLIVEDFDESNRIKNILRSRNRREIDQLFNNYTFETKVVRRGESIKELDKTIFESTPRTVIGPIPSDYGYHIIEVISRSKAGSIRSIDDVRNEILQKLTQAKIQDYYNAYIDSLFSITDYEIKYENLHDRTLIQ
ncbi:peptidyl-prolyl cis-trans isomerase [bacterium]|nr:peptidyl-prolyl cis-trans isomerase [bacterium]